MLSLNFVALGLATLAAAAPASYSKGHGKPAPPAPKPAKITDTTILNYALTLEYLEAEFYKEALATYSADDFTAAGFEDWVRPEIELIGAEEATHVAVLKSVLGKAATKACTYDFGFTGVADFVAKSFVIENIGVAAYAGAAPLVSSKQVLTYSAQILPIEARHAALVARAQQITGTPEAFDSTLGLSQVYTLASPFITSCPKSNPALPVKVFAPLTAAVSGSDVTFTFTPNKGCKKYFAYVINGLNNYSVQLPADNTITLPPTIGGRVYVVITNENKPPTDANTVAGVALFDLPSSYLN